MFPHFLENELIVKGATYSKLPSNLQQHITQQVFFQQTFNQYVEKLAYSKVNNEAIAVA